MIPQSMDMAAPSKIWMMMMIDDDDDDDDDWVHILVRVLSHLVYILMILAEYMYCKITSTF